MSFASYQDVSGETFHKCSSCSDNSKILLWFSRSVLDTGPVDVVVSFKEYSRDYMKRPFKLVKVFFNFTFKESCELDFVLNFRLLSYYVTWI